MNSSDISNAENGLNGMTLNTSPRFEIGSTAHHAGIWLKVRHLVEELSNGEYFSDEKFITITNLLFDFGYHGEGFRTIMDEETQFTLKTLADMIVEDEARNNNKALKAAAWGILGCLSPSDSSKALSCLQKAVQLQPKNHHLRRNVLFYYLDNRILEHKLDALLELRQSLLFEEHKAWCLIPEIANTLFNRGRPWCAANWLFLLLQAYKTMATKVSEDSLSRAIDSEYLLVEILLNESKVYQAIAHFKSAESKFAEIENPAEWRWVHRTNVLGAVSWLLKRSPMNAFCSSCLKKVEHPKVCGRCSCRIYCSRECQTENWRGGHKYECRSLKEGVQWQKEVMEWSETKHRWIWPEAAAMGPFDACGNPKAFWKYAIKLQKDGNSAKATMYFGLAILMDETLAIHCSDKDLDVATAAVQVYGEMEKNEDPVCLALSLVLPVFCPCVSTVCIETTMEVVLKKNRGYLQHPDLIKNIDDLDRDRMGLAMSFIFAARWISEYQPDTFASNNPIQYYSEAFRMLNVDKWPCLQLELGMFHLSLASIDDAKYWLHRARNKLFEYKQYPRCRDLLNRVGVGLGELPRLEKLLRDGLLENLDKHKKQAESKRQIRKARRISDLRQIHVSPRVLDVVRLWRSLQDYSEGYDDKAYSCEDTGDDGNESKH